MPLTVFCFKGFDRSNDVIVRHKVFAWGVKFAFTVIDVGVNYCFIYYSPYFIIEKICKRVGNIRVFDFSTIFEHDFRNIIRIGVSSDFYCSPKGLRVARDN